MLRPISIAEVRFDLREDIGSAGQNASVFRARDLQLDTDLAIKRIEKRRFSNIDEFFEEATLLYRSSHPNVVPIHYACQDDQHIYLAMPLYKNGSLRTKIAKERPTVREIITYSTQFLGGLHNIHSKGLIHFDVKPDNILLSDRGEALLSDFGLAKQISFAGTAGQDRIYAKMTPPEAFRQSEFTRLFDIYQAGLSIYRLCVGDSAFYAAYEQYFENGDLNRNRFRHAVLNAQFPPVDEFPENIPKRLIDTVRKCLRPNPQDRFTSASEVVNAFADVEGKLLDWRLESTLDYREWSKTSGERRFRLRVDSEATSVATRQVSGGAERKLSEFCKEGITRADIKRFLRRF